MKTIQYSLASVKYMEEGWTIKPPSPVEEEPEPTEDLFQIDFNTTILQVKTFSHCQKNILYL